MEYDLAFLAILGVNLLVHLSLLMKSSIVDLKKKIKAKCTCCRKKTAKKVPKTSGRLARHALTMGGLLGTY